MYVEAIGLLLINTMTQDMDFLVALELLQRHTIRQVLITDYPCVAKQLSLDTLIRQVVATERRSCYLVMECGQFLGIVTASRLQKIPRVRWPNVRVSNIMISAGQVPSVSSSENLSTVFERMVHEDIPHMAVIDQGQLQGIITRGRMKDFLVRFAVETT
jgi:predicted transcriptional regulator